MLRGGLAQCHTTHSRSTDFDKSGKTVTESEWYGDGKRWEFRSICGRVEDLDRKEGLKQRDGRRIVDESSS